VAATAAATATAAVAATPLGRGMSAADSALSPSMPAADGQRDSLGEGSVCERPAKPVREAFGNASSQPTNTQIRRSNGSSAANPIGINKLIG
jgi:hypothetical protein